MLPRAGAPQSSDQSVQANGASSPGVRSSVAGTHGPSSTRTSTPAMGAPQAAPTMRYAPPRRVTWAGADFSRARPTEVSTHTGRRPPRRGLLPEGDVVAGHEAVHQAGVPHLDRGSAT